jgi:hypothetical protein
MIRCTDKKFPQIAAYVDGLLLCWYFIMFTPELKNDIADDEVNNKC